MENIIVLAYSDEKISEIVSSDFQKNEFRSETSKRELIVIHNLLILVDSEQQLIRHEIEGVGRLNYYDDLWVHKEAIAHLYYELHNINYKSLCPNLQQQVYFRIIKNKLHVGVRPGANFFITLNERNNIIECIVTIEFFGKCYRPDYSYIALQIEEIKQIILDSVKNPTLDLTEEDVEKFLNDGEEKGIKDYDQYGFYDEEDDDDDNYEEEDDYEQEYRNRSMEEQGYDDYDYIHGRSGNDEYDDEYDEEYEIHKQESRRQELIENFMYYQLYEPNTENET